MKNTTVYVTKKRIYAMTECAILLALAVVLSYVKIFQLPFDGSITLFSMLPLCLISIKYGIKWGLGAAFCYSWFQILQGGVFAWGLTPVMLIGSLFLDYILAFTVLGLAGIFRKKGYLGMVLGIVLVCALRFLVHFLAGVILWANFEEFIAFGQSWVNRPVLYSICYNGIYMLPETILTSVMAAVILKIPQIKKLITGEIPATVNEISVPSGDSKED